MAIVLIRPLALELPYASGKALKRQKKKKERKRKKERKAKKRKYGIDTYVYYTYTIERYSAIKRKKSCHL